MSFFLRCLLVLILPRLRLLDWTHLTWVLKFFGMGQLALSLLLRITLNNWLQSFFILSSFFWSAFKSKLSHCFFFFFTLLSTRLSFVIRESTILLLILSWLFPFLRYLKSGLLNFHIRLFFTLWKTFSLRHFSLRLVEILFLLLPTNLWFQWLNYSFLLGLLLFAFLLFLDL